MKEAIRVVGGVNLAISRGRADTRFNFTTSQRDTLHSITAIIQLSLKQMTIVGQWWNVEIAFRPGSQANGQPAKT